MKITVKIAKISVLSMLLLLSVVLCACGKKEIIRNNANLSLDLGIGNTHYADESDFPAPSANAYLDVHASKIVIRDAYENASLMETPFIYNNSSTAYPRMKLDVCRNKMFVVYCPDISVPSIQFASTDDGGKSWTQSTFSLKTEMDAIDNFTTTFWTPRDGALIATNGTIETFIYVTADGGKSWKKQESAPPEQDWHDLLEYGTFLSRDIGIISYDYHSKPANQPNVYLTTDGSATWRPLYIAVPDSVMDAYAKAGKPYYDGEKIIIPINIFSHANSLVNTVQFVSYDLGQNWNFFVDDGGKAEQLRLEEVQKWVQANRHSSLLFAKYEITKFAEYEVVEYSDNVRIDVYSVDIAYTVGDREWNRFKLTHEMYFDDQMRIIIKDGTGAPLLFFIYEGDVFEYTYRYLGSMGQKSYSKQSSQKVVEKMVKELETKDEITELVNSALEAYSWFTPYVTNTIYNPEISTYFNGYTYLKAQILKGFAEVNEDADESTEGTEEPEDTEEAPEDTSTELVPVYFETEQELREYLETIFTPATASNLFRLEGNSGEQIFAEIDGALYRVSDFTSEHANSDVQFTYKITLDSDKKATVTFTVEKDHLGNDVNVTYSCKLTNTADGWRFDTFDLPIAYISDNSGTTGVSGSVITNILDWAELEYSGDALVYDLVCAILNGEYANVAAILDRGMAVDYIYLGPVSNNAYKISKRTRNDVDTIVVEVNDPINNKYYTRYIRQTAQGITLTES